MDKTSFTALVLPVNNKQLLEMFVMSNNNVHLWHFSPYKYCKNNNETMATKNTCEVYSKDTIKVKITQLWFSNIRSGDFSLIDKPLIGRPLKIHDDMMTYNLYIDYRFIVIRKFSNRHKSI